MESTALHLGIFSDSHMLLGTIAMCEIDHKRKRAVLGFWLTSDQEGNGITKNASKALLEYGKHIGIYHFEMHTSTKNVRARALAESCSLRRYQALYIV